LLEHAEHVVTRFVGGDLEHGAVGPHRRRADLQEEVAGDRHPGGMAAGELVEADVAERVDQQRGRGLGVRRGIGRHALAAEQQLVADDDVPLVGDRLPDDGDVGAAGGGIGENAHLSHGRQRRGFVEPRTGLIHNSRRVAYSREGPDTPVRTRGVPFPCRSRSRDATFRSPTSCAST
jgi:hypothetical protein